MSELSATLPYGSGATVETGAAYGRFVVVRLLGQGGMGVVFAARDPELDREVAIKILQPADGLDGEVLQREAQAMARLSHPNVVTVYEVGRAHDQTFIAMELVAGTTLRGWLDERARPWREVIAMFVAAGRGLEAAHRAELVHRDFKPENVLVGSDGRPRVTDFGLVLETVSPARSGGTPAYMAPEQWAKHAVDARADQFAFAVALWRAVYGTAPFAGDDAEALALAVLAGKIVAPAAGGVPPGVEAALRRALQREPAARWPSLGGLLGELERVTAPPPRRSWVLPALVGATLAGGIAVAVAIAMRPSAPITEPSATPIADNRADAAAVDAAGPAVAADAGTPDAALVVADARPAVDARIVAVVDAGVPVRVDANRHATLDPDETVQVGVGNIAVVSGKDIDTAAVKRALERAGPRIASCVLEARHGGLNIKHLEINSDIDDDGTMHRMVIGSDDEQFVPCFSTAMTTVLAPKHHPGTVEFVFYFSG